MTKIIKLITIMLIVLLTFLMAGCSNGMFHEVESGDVEAVRVLLDKDPGLIRSRDKDGYTMLHRAAQQGHLQLMKLLIDKGAPVDERSHDGSNLTSLHLAANEDQIATVKLLLEKGADIDARGKGERYKGWSALAFASWNNYKGLVELLIEKGAPLKGFKRDKINPLWFPVYKGHKEITELLLAKGAVVDVPGSKAWGTLHIAVEKGYPELVQVLLEHGADVNRVAYGKTPLSVMIYWKRDHKEITRLLLAHGAEVNTINYYRETPLHQAARYGFPGSAELLLQNGAKPNIISDMGSTPLGLADRNGRKAVVRLLLSLHTAAKKGDLTAVSELVKTHPQLINARDLDHKTPLHHAAENNHLKIANLLIENGAAVNVRCKYKSIQLLYGAVAKILVPRLGRVKRIKDQKTPLDFALQKGYSQMALLLISRKSMQKKQAFEMTPPKERHQTDREAAGVADPHLIKGHMKEK
jgi:ankyrin repeat protein